MWKINTGKVLWNLRYADQIALVDVRDYAIAVTMLLGTLVWFMYVPVSGLDGWKEIYNFHGYMLCNVQ